MHSREKKSFSQLYVFGSLTLLASLNMVYLIVKARDPFSPYLLSDLISSVPFYPYFWLSLVATIGLFTGTLLKLTSAIQTDMEALLHRHMILEHLGLEASPDMPLEPSPLVTAHRAPASPEEATIHTLNKQVQTLHTEITKQYRDALINELYHITVAATATEPQSDHTEPHLIVEARPPDPQLNLDSSPCAIKGIGVKTERALQMIGITTVSEFLVADPEWIAEHTYLTSKRVRQFQDAAYDRVTPTAQPLLSPPAIAPTIT